MNRSLKCQMYKGITSICLRPYSATLNSLTRGSIDLCLEHFEEQEQLDHQSVHRSIAQAFWGGAV